MNAVFSCNCKGSTTLQMPKLVNRSWIGVKGSHSWGQQIVVVLLKLCQMSKTVDHVKNTLLLPTLYCAPTDLFVSYTSSTVC